MEESHFSKKSMKSKDLRNMALGLGTVIVLTGVVAGMGIHQHNKQVEASRINSEMAFARKETSKMNHEKDDQKRINYLRALEKDAKKYSKKKVQDKKVTNYYTWNISSGRKYFVDRTSKRIQACAMSKDQLEKINQKDLQKKVDDLNNEKTFVEQNKKVVYPSDIYDTFTKNINKLLTRYNKKLLALNKKAEEESSKKASLAAQQSSIAAAASSSSNSTTNNTATSSAEQNGSGTSSYTANAGTNNGGYNQTTTYSGSTGNTSNYSDSSGSTSNNGGGSTYHAASSAATTSSSNTGVRTGTWWNNLDGAKGTYADGVSKSTTYTDSGSELGGFNVNN